MKSYVCIMLPGQSLSARCSTKGLAIYLGLHLLTWINLNLNMDNYIHYKVWDEITYPFLNFNGATVEV